MTPRIARGFHRIGVVLAVPVLLVAVGLAGHEAWLQWTTSRLPDETQQWQDGSVSVVRSFNYHPADLTFAGFVLALALAFYVTARAIGWILAGFMGPSASNRTLSRHHVMLTVGRRALTRPRTLAHPAAASRQVGSTLAHYHVTT